MKTIIIDFFRVTFYLFLVLYLTYLTYLFLPILNMMADGIRSKINLVIEVRNISDHAPKEDTSQDNYPEEYFLYGMQ